MQKKETNEKDVATSWGGVADWYDDLLEGSGDSFQSKVIMPNLLRVLDPKPGMHILDVACGQGYFTRAFAQNGATVIGCDISAELVALAEQASAVKASSEAIKYVVAPAHDLSFVPDASQHAVTIVLALQNIEDVAGTLTECSRTLKPAGRLLFVLNHPAFRIPRRSSWGWDEGKDRARDHDKQYRRIDGYMSDARLEIDMRPGEPVVAKKKLTVSFHRPIQSYVKALAKAGLSITRLEEWISHKKSQKGPRAAEEDRIRKEIPMFLFVEARKG